MTAWLHTRHWQYNPELHDLTPSSDQFTCPATDQLLADVKHRKFRHFQGDFQVILDKLNDLFSDCPAESECNYVFGLVRSGSGKCAKLVCRFKQCPYQVLFAVG